jgi:hypothetical protein
MLYGSLVFGIHPRFHMYYLVIANPAYPKLHQSDTVKPGLIQKSKDIPGRKKRLIIKRRQAKRQKIGTTIHPSKRNVKLNVVKHITTMSAQC